MRWGLLCVLVLALSAGCSAFGGTMDGPASPTVTPAPVPTDVPTPETTTPAVAPGVVTTGVENVSVLVDHHVRAARNTSWVWTARSRLTERYGTETVVSRTNQTVWYVGERRYRQTAFRTSNHSAGVSTALGHHRKFVDGSVGYETWFAAEGGRVVYRRDETPRAAETFAGFAAKPIGGLLALDSATVSRVAVGTRPHYEILGSRLTLGSYGPVESYRARAIVRSDGFVRHLNVSYTIDQPDFQVVMHYEFTYRQVGNATVERPDWVETARNRTEDQTTRNRTGE
jgi:hypothetical protein